MKLYKVGRVADTTTMKNTIILETNYEGHIVHVGKPADFEVGKVVKLFVFEQLRADGQMQLFGFKTFNEWDRFTELVTEGLDCWKAMKQTAYEKPAEALHQPEEVRSPLKTLGFNQEQIDGAVSIIKPADSVEVLVEEAIRKICNGEVAKAQEEALAANSNKSKGRAR